MSKYDCYGGVPYDEPDYDDSEPPKTFKISEVDECGHGTFGSFGRCLYKYTDCGPWVVAVLPDGTEVYYESREAYDLPIDTSVVALRVGSIVEGWDDGAVGPEDVTDPERFWKAVEEINEEASRIWDIVNSDHFGIKFDGDYVGCAKVCWGEVEMDCGLNAKARRRIRRYLEKALYLTRHKTSSGGFYTPKHDQEFRLTKQISLVYYEPEIYW